MRCNKYYLQGPKKGTIEKFCEVLGMPDNIHYDGEGHYLIATFTVLHPPASQLILTAITCPPTHRSIFKENETNYIQNSSF